MLAVWFIQFEIQFQLLFQKTDSSIIIQNWFIQKGKSQYYFR